MNTVLMALISAVVTSLFLFLLLYPKQNRHSRKIDTASRVLSKISTFRHDGQKIVYLRKIDPFVFEELLLTAFENRGYTITRNKKYTGDGGIDGTIFDADGNKILIQAKRYSSYINPRHLAAFSDLVEYKKAQKGFFIHTGKSSSAARDLFRHSNIDIIGGSNMLRLILDVQ